MKISTSLTSHLETNNQFKGFWREYKSLHSRDSTGQKYANTIAGCMEIVHDLNEKKIPYCILGGLAVAFHLHQVDHNAFLKWRGTSDIDLLVAKKVVGGILRKNDYTYRQVLRGLKAAKQGVYDYVKDDNGETLVLGLRESIQNKKGKDITNKILNNSSLVDVYSVPIRVPMIRDLVQMKRFANRAKDREDIKLLRQKYKGLKL